MASLVSHPDEVRVVSKRFGQGATNIDRYLELDGYKAVQKALGMTPDAIINEIKTSNLRGLVSSPPTGWTDERLRDYVVWAEQVVRSCRGLNAKLEAQFDAAYDTARRHFGA